MAEIIFHQFKSPLIYILLIAAVISLLLDDFKDAGFIFLVVMINAIIDTIQEWKAEQSATHSLLRAGPLYHDNLIVGHYT
jgi:magnesium-transporting ATPase (P-type)